MTDKQKLVEWLDLQIKALDNAFVKLGDYYVSNLSLHCRQYIHVEGIRKIAELLDLELITTPRNDKDYPIELSVMYKDIKVFEIFNETGGETHEE